MSALPQHPATIRARPVARSSRWRVLGWLLSIPLLICGNQPSPAGDDAISKEYQIKAAFIYNFTKFVEWPAGAFVEPTSPIVIGLLGGNPFGNELSKLVEGRKVNGREIVIRPLTSLADASPLHLLFISSEEESRLGQHFAALKGRPVLTVGERDVFTRWGGAIALTLEGDRVRFAINMEAADAARLKVSAQLQKLATSVKRQP